MDKLILKDDIITFSGFDKLPDGDVYFAFHTYGVVLYGQVAKEKDCYYHTWIQNRKIKSFDLCQLLKNRGYGEETVFVYADNNHSYLELEPTKAPTLQKDVIDPEDQ